MPGISCCRSRLPTCYECTSFTSIQEEPRCVCRMESPNDEDFPIFTLTPITTEDVPANAKKDQSNENRIGPITLARAKLLEQQVNSLLNESDVYDNENFILPKSMHLCMIRFVEETSLTQEGEWLQEEPSMMIAKDARGRSGRKAQEKIIKKESSVRTDRSPEIETDVDSSYELQIKKISTCWKDHSEIFPTSTYTSPGGG